MHRNTRSVSQGFVFLMESCKIKTPHFRDDICVCACVIPVWTDTMRLSLEWRLLALLVFTRLQRDVKSHRSLLPVTINFHSCCSPLFLGILFTLPFQRFFYSSISRTPSYIVCFIHFPLFSSSFSFVVLSKYFFKNIRILIIYLRFQVSSRSVSQRKRARFTNLVISAKG